MLRILLRIFIYTILFVAFITFGPSALLLDIQPQAIEIPFPKSFTGPLEANNRLSSAQKLFENQIQGPESIAAYNGSIFTGSNDGYIYKIDGNNNLIPVIKLINNECPDVWNRSSCGRPLGLKFDSNGVLYVVEPSHGIYTVEDVLTNTPKVKRVFNIKQTKSFGKASRFLDDIAIDENVDENGGIVLYMSDASTKYDIYDAMLALDYDTGRIIKYNNATKKLYTVIDGLLMPNGLELTDDKNSILVCETFSRRILKHYIRGPKAGQTIILISSLPGEPDNTGRSATMRETYWITFTTARNESSHLLSDTINRYPLVKKFIGRFHNLIGSIIVFIGNAFGNHVFRDIGFGLKTGNLLVSLGLKTSTFGMIVEFDVNGNILQSLHSPDGSVSILSEAREVKISGTESVLYLGSFFNEYLGKLMLKNRI